MHEQLLRVTCPLPEAPPRGAGAGALGPAKAEVPALSKAAHTHLYSTIFCLASQAFLAAGRLSQSSPCPITYKLEKRGEASVRSERRWARSLVAAVSYRGSIYSSTACRAIAVHRSHGAGSTVYQAASIRREVSMSQNGCSIATYMGGHVTHVWRCGSKYRSCRGQ